MGPNKQQHAKDMLRWQTEPGSVAFYNIWPGNEAGLFLQPQSPYRAVQWKYDRMVMAWHERMHKTRTKNTGRMGNWL